MLRTNKFINICIKLLFIYSLCSELIYSYFPSSLLFTIPDLLLLVSILFVIFDSYSSGKIKIKNPHVSIAFFIFLILFLLISFSWGNLNAYDFVARIRYILGAFLVYYMTNSYLDDRTFSSLIDTAYVAQIFNLLLVLYQHLVLHLHPDFTNGIFGFTNYANGIQGFYCLALSILSIVYYLDGKWGAVKSLLLIAISCIICALAEIKIFFVIFILSIFLIFIFQKSKTVRKTRIISATAGISLLFLVAYKIIEMVLPDNLYTFFNVTKALSYENRTEFAGRTNTISFLWDNLFYHDYVSAIFGKGLGSYSVNYIYELGKMLADGGFISVVLLYLFLLSLFIRGTFTRDKDMQCERLIVSIIAFVVMMSIVVWNCTFTRSTYIVFFFLGLGNVAYKSTNSIRGDLDEN